MYWKKEKNNNANTYTHEYTYELIIYLLVN